MSASETAPRITRPPDAFEFGRNWQRYVAQYLDPERIAIAAASLDELLRTELRGKTFLDVGAGSGLFSLCAHRAGAASVVSVDVDPNSVESCRLLRDRAGAPATWRVLEGSILDPALVAGLAPADVVYSWGVLHHTGDMETALRNAASLVLPGGLFAIAVYNRVTGRFLDSRRWWTIKHAYNHSPRAVQRVLEAAYLAYWAATQLRARRNPCRVAAEYKRSRGMALMTDLVDWLGGYPYEYATVAEIVAFCTRELGLRLVRTIETDPRGTGNNQFVFERPG